jgi:uncharacterized protein (DUF302 family)
MNRLEAGIRAAGMTVFAHIDHAARSAGGGLFLRPTEVLIFGDAQNGPSLIQVDQMIGIDLPMRAMVWQDESGSTWLTYYDPRWLAKRHGLDDKGDEAISNMARTLRALARAATGGSVACRASHARLRGPKFWTGQALAG